MIPDAGHISPIETSIKRQFIHFREVHASMADSQFSALVTCPVISLPQERKNGYLRTAWSLFRTSGVIYSRLVLQVFCMPRALHAAFLTFFNGPLVLDLSDKLSRKRPLRSRCSQTFMTARSSPEFNSTTPVGSSGLFIAAFAGLLDKQLL